MIVREPSRWLLEAFIDRCRMQADMLVVDDIPPTFSISCKKLRIKAPCYNGVEHQLVRIILHVSFWNFYEMPLVKVEPNSKTPLVLGNKRSTDVPWGLPIEGRLLGFVQVYKASVNN